MLSWLPAVLLLTILSTFTSDTALLKVSASTMVLSGGLGTSGKSGASPSGGVSSGAGSSRAGSSGTGSSGAGSSRAGSSGTGSSGAGSASNAGKAAENLFSASDDHSGFITGSMTSKPAAPAKGTTTMYVSSALCGRHGLCVLLENVDQKGTHRFGMVDTGNASSTVMRSFLKSHGVKSLEFLVLTHMHDDHIGNAVYLLKNYPVKSLYLKQFDAHWSDGIQSTYEKILQTAASNTSTKKIAGVSYALSISRTASPSASAGFVSWMKSHADSRSRFKGLFTDSNISFRLGSSTVQLFNWEIWSRDGVTRWQPGRTLRCRADAFSKWNSDNHFSLGVRVSQGTRRLWIGGDMNNLRLVKKKGSPYKGDEDRLRTSVGPVDAMVMNHHGRGGSNTSAFLQTLSPSYVVYTSLRGEVVNKKRSHSLASFQYLKKNLHLSEDHILWASNYWNVYPEDPVITVSSSQLVSAEKDGTDIAHWKGTNGANCTAVSLNPGHTYSSYDLTGDGRADRIQILSDGSGSAHKSLTIRVNKQEVFSFKKSFSDAQPVTLLLQPGHRAFLCISILSPKDERSRILRLYSCKSVSGKTLALDTVFDVLQTVPDRHFSCEKASVIKVTADQIVLSCTGSDSLGSRTGSGSKKSSDPQSASAASSGTKGPSAQKYSGGTAGSSPQNKTGSTNESAAQKKTGTKSGKKATFTFCLTASGEGLKNASPSCRYTIGKDSRIRFSNDMPLYQAAGSTTAGGTLPAGTVVTVTHACRNKAGALRYRITTPEGKNWWIE